METNKLSSCFDSVKTGPGKSTEVVRKPGIGFCVKLGFKHEESTDSPAAPVSIISQHDEKGKSRNLTFEEMMDIVDEARPLKEQKYTIDHIAKQLGNFKIGALRIYLNLTDRADGEGINLRDPQYAKRRCGEVQLNKIIAEYQSSDTE